MSPKHNATRALAAGLATAALAAPPALADDPRSPGARHAAAAQAQQRGDNLLTGGVRAPDLLSPNARDAATPVAPAAAAPTPAAPTVVEVSSAQGFDWTSAAIGAAAGIALALIAIAATAAVSSRSRPAPH